MITFNTTGIIFTLVDTARKNLFGSMDLTLLVLFVGILVLLLAFRIPLEIGLIFVFPVLIMFGAFYGGFTTALVLASIFLGLILAKWFII